MHYTAGACITLRHFYILALEKAMSFCTPGVVIEIYTACSNTTNSFQGRGLNYTVGDFNQHLYMTMTAEYVLTTFSRVSDSFRFRVMPWKVYPNRLFYLRLTDLKYGYFQDHLTRNI